LCTASYRLENPNALGLPRSFAAVAVTFVLIQK
jgi:hypothetical protein